MKVLQARRPDTNHTVYRNLGHTLGQQLPPPGAYIVGKT